MSEWVGYYEFTKEEVLRQVNDHPGRMNRTAYLNIRILQSVKAKGRHNSRRPQMTSRIRRLLDNLVTEGALERLQDQHDGLGHEWNLTDLGRAMRSD